MSPTNVFRDRFLSMPNRCTAGNCGHFKQGRYRETGPTVYSPYPRRLESLTNVITKVALIFQLF